MSNELSDNWRIWFDLERKENELKWGGYQPSSGIQYDSMGRIASSSIVSWGHEQMSRVSRVREALDRSGPLAQRMVMESLSGINLSTIWHILVEACKDIALYYGGSVAAGGIIGGIGGAFVGGAGAIPGAAGGAAVGSYVGGVVLAMLGLKSLVEEATLSIPESVGYYQRGFVEAWGPLRQDQHGGFGPTSRGDPTAAASQFAQGHVILVMAILTALVSYLTRGRGNKTTLLNDIGRSPRLGPKVARWVEENEARLRNHPALQSRRRSGAMAEPPAPKRKTEHDNNPIPRGMPRKHVPCFNTNDLPKDKIPEFDRQIAGQESGLNAMSVDEYLKGRKAFEDGISVRDPTIARQARAKYERDMRDEIMGQLRDGGMGAKEAKAAAKKRASEVMSTLAALHNPDMVAAGKDVISDFGDRNINSRLGAQWTKGNRLVELDRAANAIAKSMRNSKMNVKLERCK